MSSLPVVSDLVVAVAFEPEDFEKLKRINSRLFDATIMNDDQRRDLANAMQVILWRAIQLSKYDLK